MPKYYRGVGAQVTKFAQDRIVQTKGRWAGKPLHLEKWEQELIDELFLVDEDGKRVYKEALVGIARKNGKSTLSAAIALYSLIATGEQGPEVYCAAASRDQARIVFNQAREFVEASPKLLEWLQPMRNVITCRANNGVFRVLSADAPLQHGLNPSAVIIDELHAHGDPELYYALTTGSLARSEPLVVSITTAGYDRETICWDVYQHGKALRAKGRDAMRKAGFLFEWHEAPADAQVTDKKAWMKANPSSWITQKVLEREQQRLPENVFRRLHMNQWTESEDAWIKPDDFDACAGKPLITGTDWSWAALDVGITRDASAIVSVQWRRADGRRVKPREPARDDDKLHVKHDIRIPTRGKPIAAEDNRVRLKKLAGRLEGLREIPYDPYGFRESAEMLADEGLPMLEYQQNNPVMVPASERIYELFREHRVVHDGDEIFRRQLLAAVASETERGWRISKRLSKERIDAAVSLTMAADRAVLSRIDPGIDVRDIRITRL